MSPIDQAQQRLLIKLGLIWLFIGMVPMAVLWMSAPEALLNERARPAMNAGLYLLTCGLIVVLARLRQVRTAALIVCIAQVFLVLVAAFWVGFGVRAVAFAQLPVLISFTCFFYGLRAAIAMTGGAIAFVLTIFGLQTAGVIASATADFQPLIITTWVVLLATYIGMSLIYRHYEDLISGSLYDIQQHKMQTAKVLKDLRQAEKQRATFLGTLSHSFRTPVSGIRMAQDILRNPRANAAFRKRAVNNLRTSARKLQVLVRQLRDASLLAEGRLQLNQIGFDLASLVQSCCKDHHADAAEKGIEIRLQPMPVSASQMVVGDAERVNQMLAILLDNAIKYQTGGELEVQLLDMHRGSTGSMNWRVEVRDRGLGIPDSAKKQLFLPFGQLDVHVHNLTEGSGLGLAVLKGISEAMGGTCGFDHRDGGGSVFWFEAPLKTQTAAPAGAGTSAKQPERRHG